MHVGCRRDLGQREIGAINQADLDYGAEAEFNYMHIYIIKLFRCTHCMICRHFLMNNNYL